MAEPKLKIVITADGKQYTAELDKLTHNMQRVEDGAKTTAAEASHLTGQMKALYGAMVAAGAVTLVKKIIDINTEFQRLNASLVTVTGSTAAADTAFASIEKFATNTPYQLQEVVSAFVRLKAMGLDASEESLRSYGNTASAMGKSLDQMIEAVADAATGEFERLKEFGIKASVQGDKVSLRFKGVTTVIGNSADEISGYLRKIGDEDFAGGMARQMDTLGGKFSNLEDSAGMLARSIGKAGLNDLIGDITTELTQAAIAIDAFVKDPTKLPDWAKIGAFTLFKLKQEFVDLGDVIGATMAILDLKVGDGFFTRLDSILDGRKRKREALEAEAQQFVATLEGIGKKEQAAISVVPVEPTRPAPSGGVKDAKGTGKKSDDQAAQDYGKYMYELARQAYPEATQSAEEYGQAMAKIVVEQTNTANDAYIARLAEAERVTLAARTATEVLSDEMVRLNGLWLAGDISTETYTQSIANAEQGMKDLGDSGSDAFKELVAASKGWGDEFTNAMAEMVMSGKISFKSLAESIIKDLLRIAIYQKITAPILQGLGLISVPLKHSGGPVTGSGVTRNVSPLAFMGAPRYHSGGAIQGLGLKPGEVPIIAQQGESVIPRGGISVPAPVIEINNYTGQPVRQEQSTVDGKAMVRLFIGEAAADVRRGGELGSAISQSFGVRRPGTRVS